MKVLGICGSTRPDSNSKTLTNLVLGEIKARANGVETELIELWDKKINECMYDRCKVQCRRKLNKEGQMVAGFSECVQKDDFGPIFEKMLEADGIIFSCPVYFGAAPGHLRSLLNRAGLGGESAEYYNIIAQRRAAEQGTTYILPTDPKSIEEGRYGRFRRKLGGAIVTTRRTGANFTYLELVQWFLIENMFVVPGIYWNIALCGAIGARDALRDEEAVHNLEIFAENFAWALPRIRG